MRACAGELERRLDPQRAVEMQVQLGLGHRPDQAAAGAGLEVARRRRHRPMLRFRPPMRHILLALAWLAAVVLIALGAAGLLAGLDTPTTAGSRPWLTRAATPRSRLGSMRSRPTW